MRQFLCLFLIVDNESVQKTRASDLKLRLVRALANFDEAGVLTTSLLEEVTNVGDLLRHDDVLKQTIMCDKKYYACVLDWG